MHINKYIHIYTYMNKQTNTQKSKQTNNHMHEYMCI